MIYGPGTGLTSLSECTVKLFGPKGGSPVESKHRLVYVEMSVNATCDTSSDNILARPSTCKGVLTSFSISPAVGATLDALRFKLRIPDASESLGLPIHDPKSLTAASARRFGRGCHLRELVQAEAGSPSRLTWAFQASVRWTRTPHQWAKHRHRPWRRGDYDGGKYRMATARSRPSMPASNADRTLEMFDRVLRPVDAFIDWKGSRGARSRFHREVPQGLPEAALSDPLSRQSTTSRWVVSADGRHAVYVLAPQTDGMLSVRESLLLWASGLPKYVRIKRGSKRRGGCCSPEARPPIRPRVSRPSATASAPRPIPVFSEFVRG